MPGVTTVLAELNKPYLMNWYGTEEREGILRFMGKQAWTADGVIATLRARSAGVFNLDTNTVQVFSWTQKKLNKRLAAKLNAGKKGSPMDLALTVTFLDTTPVDYDLDVEKAEPYTAAQQAAIDSVLSEWTGPAALLDNSDPFAPFTSAPTAKCGRDDDLPF